jgi:hypothetical protein
VVPLAERDDVVEVERKIAVRFDWRDVVNLEPACAVPVGVDASSLRALVVASKLTDRHEATEAVNERAEHDLTSCVASLPSERRRSFDDERDDLVGESLGWRGGSLPLRRCPKMHRATRVASADAVPASSSSTSFGPGSGHGSARRGYADERT